MRFGRRSAAGNRLARLRRGDLRLLTAAFVVQVMVGIALRIVPLRSLQRAIARHRATARHLATGSEERLAWAIEGVGRRLPWISTCLVRALAADLFLGEPTGIARVRIGVRRAENGTLESHAWFEHGDRIVVGGAGAAGYTPFMILE